MTPIDPESWRRADAVFQNAIERPAEEREAFVARACAGDDALLAAVRALMAADESGGGILDASVGELAASILPDASEAERAGAEGDGGTGAGESDEAPTPDPLIGRTLGRFRIVARLGEGGMGIVYEAEQEEPRRRVALKVMRGGWSVDAEGLRFFRREAQTLARLQHPGIAAIYEAGRTDDGQPFFAMELVRGVPLDAAFASGDGGRRGATNAADLRARLDLFLEVCDAIVYAHQRGVSHRDLKPSNILVAAEAVPIGGARGADPSTSSTTRSPRVKVVDFGLARISDADVTMVTSRSEPRALQGTLPYMSPEQTLGRPEEIDFRSDVYSLGVILYKLLTGEPPYIVRAEALLEAVRTIREEIPRKAGAVVPLLRGEVETILAKALEKDPDRRYQSVAMLADDVRRFLTDQPILARPPSAAYQLRKLAARHRAAAALVTALFVVLVGSTITMTLLYDAQRREREKAVVEAEKARSMSEFLSDMLTSVDPELAKGKDVTVRQVLDEASRNIEPELAENPEVAAALQTSLGRAYRVLGLYEKAEPQLHAALETRRRIQGDESAEVAASLQELGYLALQKGRYAEAESLVAIALSTRRILFGERHRDTAASYFLAAMVAYERGNHARADSLHRIALGIRREVLGDDAPEVLTSTTNLALAVHGAGRQAEAESLYRAAVDLAAQRYGEDHPAHAECLNNLGLLLHDQGRWDEAEAIFRRALAVRRVAFGNQHPEVGISVSNLARSLRTQQRYEEAVQLYQEASAIIQTSLGEGHSYTQTMRNNLALVYDLMGRRDLAIKMYEDAIESMKPTIGPDHSTIAVTTNNLATSLQRDGQLERAAAIQSDAIAMVRRLYGAEHPSVAQYTHNLAAIWREQKRVVEAESLETVAYAMRKKLLGEDHLNVAESAGTLAVWAFQDGDIETAIRRYEEALAIKRKQLPADNWSLAKTASQLGGCLARAGRYAAAESLLLASEPILSKSASVSAADKRTSLVRLVDLYDAWGKPAEAAKYREAAAKSGSAGKS